MATTRKITSLYEHLVSRIKNQEKLASYERWVILNYGQVKLVDHSYEIPVRLAPASWHSSNSPWADFNITDLDRSQIILTAYINLEEYETMVPGTIISNKGKYLGCDGERMKVLIEAPRDLDPSLRLFDCLPRNLFNKLPFRHNNPGIPVYKLQAGQITYIIPKTEIARYYFFVGSKITKLLCEGVYENQVAIPGILLLNDASGKKTAFVKMSEGYTDREKIVLAQLAVDDHYKKTADFIVKLNFAKKEGAKQKGGESNYLQANFFQQTPVAIGCTGLYLDPPHNQYFYVNQIHQTKEARIFDLLVIMPKVDHRQMADQSEREKLLTETYKPKKLLHKPGTKVELTQDPEAISSDSTILQNPILQEKFFEDIQDVVVTTLEKLSQDKKYEAEGTYRIIIDGKVTLSSKVSAKATSMKSVVENIPLLEREIQQLYILNDYMELIKAAINEENTTATFYNNSANEPGFQEEFHVLPLGSSFSLIVVNFDYNGRQFYLFDLYYQHRSLNRTQILHSKTYGIISAKQIEIIIEMMNKDTSWNETFKSLKKEFVTKGFNHRVNSFPLTLAEVGSNINVYMTNRNYSSQKRF